MLRNKHNIHIRRIPPKSSLTFSKAAFNLIIPVLELLLCQSGLLLAYVGDCRVKEVKEFVISLG